MNIITLRRRLHADSERIDSGFALRLVLVAPLMIAASVVGVLFPAEEESRRYDGHFGAEPSGKMYDNLMPAEHDELGRWWNP